MAQPQSDGQLASELAALYVLAEQQLLAGGATALRQTSGDIFVTVATIRALARRIVTQLGARTDPLIRATVSAAVAAGRDTASTQLTKLAGQVRLAGGSGNLPPSKVLDLPEEPFNLSLPHSVRSAEAIIRDLSSELQDVRYRITRLPDDIYKAIAPHGAIYQVHDNPFTPAQAQAAAWRVFTSQGVRGFTDRSGRNWSLSAYTEMAVRTAAMRAYNDSHLQVMRAVGINLFTVSDDGHPCPLCLPWQNRVVCDQPDGVHPTIADAVAAGLLHPNCRHVWIPVIPGFTKLPAPEVWSQERQDAYDLTQKQRRLELAIRKAKRAVEYALTPDAKAEALADVRAGQARMRQFLADNPTLLRYFRREQVDLTDGRIKMPTPIR